VTPTNPAVIENVALLLLARTVTVPGTGTDLLSLLVRETTAALGVALFKDTVHVPEALPARVDGKHTTEVSCIGATRFSVAV